MRLLDVQYWVGKSKENTLIVPIEMDNKGILVGLKASKLNDNDIKRMRNKIEELANMSPKDMMNWLDKNVPSFRNALVTLKKGRYKIQKEYVVNG